MGALFSGISSILSGGATGLIGVVIQRFADYKNKQLDMALAKQNAELELAKLDRETEQIKAETAGKIEVTRLETESAKDVADTNAFAASLTNEPQRYMPNGTTLTPGQTWAFVVLDVIRGVIRPVLTLYLCVIATYLYFDAHSLLNGQKLSPEEALNVVVGIVDTILYLWVTCTTWWFGTRNKQAAPKSIKVK